MVTLSSSCAAFARFPYAILGVGTIGKHGARLALARGTVDLTAMEDIADSDVVWRILPGLTDYATALAEIEAVAAEIAA